MEQRASPPFPFPTASRHDAPALQPIRPVERAPDETAIDHGIEESFPASDPISVSVTKAEPKTPCSDDAANADRAHARPVAGHLTRSSTTYVYAALALGLVVGCGVAAGRMLAVLRPARPAGNDKRGTRVPKMRA